MESEMTAPVAAPPEFEREQSLESNGLKRRRSEEGEQSLKRQRTSPGKNSPNATEDAASAETTSLREETEPPTELSKTEHIVGTKESRRKSSVVEEKQRSKRLFGALLGNLSQPSDRVSKRRAEIEQRRKAELQKQDDKRIEDRQRRLEKLAEHRRKEQEKLDEENMYRRHDDMLHQARFLLTITEPRLYYLPWELLPHQEDIIEDQIRDAKIKIDEELAEFEERKRRRTEQESAAKSPQPIDECVPKNEGADGEVSNTFAGDVEASTQMIDNDKQTSPRAVEATKYQPEVKHLELSSLRHDGDTVSELIPASSEQDDETQKNAKKEESDDDEGHMVEGDEDTVIY